MDIKTQIQNDRIAALKAGESERKAVLDYILGEIQRKEKSPSPGADIPTTTIQAYLKSLRDLSEQFADTRPDDVAKYQREIELLSAYLPTQLSDDELKEAIAGLEADGITGRGPMMKGLKARHGAAIDGRRAAAILDVLGIK